MSRFILIRILQSAFVLFLVSFFVYILIGLMPGDPVDLMLAGNPHMTPADAERLRSLYSLDKPLTERYAHWLSAALGGDFGYSRLYHLPVLEVLGERLMNSLLLMTLSLCVTLMIAIPLGVMAAAKKDSLADRFINLFCFTGAALPPFWIGLMFMILFAVMLGWLPASSAGAGWKGLVLPVATLSLAGLAGYTRHIRSAMIDQLRADHIRTARAKGCSTYRVLFIHALRGALIPLATLLALDFGTLFGGALTIETIFGWPGMGKMIFDAIMGNDYNLALIGLLVMTGAVLAGNFLADVAYAFLDPRVKLQDHKT